MIRRMAATPTPAAAASDYPRLDEAYSRHIDRVNDFHRLRTLDTLDSGATLAVGKHATQTACWTFNSGRHHIVMNSYLPGYINHKEALKLPRRKRRELQFLKSVHAHEVAHGLYTSRDFKGVNEECKKRKIPFRYLNLFEDARIEALFRGRRPTSKSGQLDLDHEGNGVKSNSYGVRKFDWYRWQEYNVDTPESVFLSILKAEGTRTQLTEVKRLFLDWESRHGPYISPDEKILIPGLGLGYILPNSKIGFDFFEKVWRHVAGRGSAKRVPTTESLIPIIEGWCKVFPGDREVEQVTGPGEDFIESVLRELGECFNPKKPPEEEKRNDLSSSDKDNRGGKETGSDDKRGGQDESGIKTEKCVLDDKELRARGLSRMYFDTTSIERYDPSKSYIGDNR